MIGKSPISQFQVTLIKIISKCTKSATPISNTPYIELKGAVDVIAFVSLLRFKMLLGQVFVIKKKRNYHP